MTKQAVVDDMVSNGMSQAEAQRAFERVFDSVDNVLSQDKPVRVVGFGTFTRKMSTRTSARNPQTGETITLIPRKVIKFKESSSRK